MGRRPIQQDDTTHIRKIDGLAVGNGVNYNGLSAAVVYVAQLGNVITRTLARNLLSGNVEARWRVGGVSLPPDFGMGIGASHAADAIWPENPQVTMRNPGIRPLAGAPATYRYAPGMGIQPIGPSIADVGNMPSK
jgi:hypothetical protein